MEKGSLRIVQNLAGEGFPHCDYEDCVGHGVGLYADKDLKGWALCGRHERELLESGVISTCSVRPPKARSACCTRPVGHGDTHEYHVDGKLDKTWSVSF
jgi:hypothetical protein